MLHCSGLFFESLPGAAHPSVCFSRFRTLLVLGSRIKHLEIRPGVFSSSSTLVGSPCISSRTFRYPFLDIIQVRCGSRSFRHENVAINGKGP